MAWDIDPGVVVGAFTAMFGALTGVVSWIGHLLSKRLDGCESKHEKQHDEAKSNAQQIGELKGELAAIKTYAGPDMAKAIAQTVVEAMRQNGP